MDALSKDILISVLRTSLNQESISIIIQEEEAAILYRIGERQSIRSMIYRAFNQTEVSPLIIEKYKNAWLVDTQQFILQHDALGKICAVLNEAEISFIPLKGAVLRDLYPSPELRTCCDIDILVQEDKLEKAVKAIEAGTDFRMEKQSYHDVSMNNSHVHLELHFSINEDMENVDRLLEKVWNYSENDGGNRYKLTPEFQIFHVIAHMSYHMLHGGIGIRSFLDLWLLRTKTKYDETLVRQFCKECSILTFYEKCCELVDAWMGGKDTPEDILVFEEYVLNGGVFGNTENALAAKQRTRRGIRYLIQRIFISRKQLEIEFPELNEKPYLILICHIKRWFRLFNRKKRLRALKEINNVMRMNPSTIDSFVSLLESLGL